MQVQGYSGPNKKVTGTNEGFLIRASVVKNHPYTGSEPWDNAQLLEVHLTIGGEEVHLKQWAAGAQDAVETYVKNVRFATTNFYDDATVNVHLTASFRLWRLGPASPPNPPPVIEELQLSTEPVTIPLKIYNKGTLLSTVVTSTGGSPTPLNPIDEVALECTDRGKDSMIRHTVNPSSGQDALTEAQVLQNLVPATYFVAATHGGDSGFNDSTHHDGSSGHISWSEVNQIVLARLLFGIPAYNLVVMYSCATLAAGNNPHDAFLANGIDRAYCGFGKEIACAYYKLSGSGIEYTTADHATVFFS